jgi:hypothetical protein
MGSPSVSLTGIDRPSRLAVRCTGIELSILTRRDAKGSGVQLTRFFGCQSGAYRLY